MERGAGGRFVLALVTAVYSLSNVILKISLDWRKPVYELFKRIKMQCLPKQVVDVLPVLGGTILTILHLVFSVFQILLKYFHIFKCKWSEGTKLKRLKSVGEEVELVSSEVKQLSQVPNHLVIILGTETISIKDVVNLVTWSCAAGIPYVSFHDHQGSLKKHRDQLDQALQTAVGKKLSISMKNGYKSAHNGSSHTQLPCVSILDASHGKELIVNVVRKLCANAEKGLIGSGQPTQDELNEILIKESGLPEAQLAIYLGSICCMYGFMPWHARITEFLPLQNSDKITVGNFLHIMKNYNKCEQRFGK